MSDDLDDLNAKHEFFMNIRQSFGRTALLLSGGGTLGLNHLGVIKCLHQAKLLPRIISGASSGSIMAALLCTKTDDEIPEMFDPKMVQLVRGTNTCYFSYSRLRKDVFERTDHPETPYMRLHRLLTQGNLYDVEILTEAMHSHFGDLTFQASKHDGQKTKPPSTIAKVSC